jgi:hypothetical protein
MVVVSSVPPVFSCSCIELPDDPIASILRRYDVVFLGKVIGRRTHIEPTKFAEYYTEYIDFDFAVLKGWKGADRPSIVVRTIASGGMCGYPFAENEVFLVFAYGGKWPVSTNLCSHTTRLEGAAKLLSSLGDPSVIYSESKGEEPPN